MLKAGQHPKQQASLQDYLKQEEASTTKHEFWDGQIIAMAGGSPAHNKIANSTGTAIDLALDKSGKDCSVFSSDQQVYIPAYNRCAYPDCTVVCGEEELSGNTMLLNQTTSSVDCDLSKGLPSNQSSLHSIYP